MKPNHSRRNKIIGFVFSLLLLVSAGFVVLNRQYIYDLFNYWSYTASGQVVSIASRSGMNDNGKFYLYTSDAEVQDATSFNSNCQKQENNNAILGCYVNKKIYIYNVDNPELDGIKEVTAAHEMLHAAWERMGSDEQTRIGKLLDQAYEQNKTPDLITRMEYYSRNEKGEETNELHSIMGTEFANLSPELESYYSKYFSNRGEVTNLYKNYKKVFDEISSNAEALYKELTDLSADIDKLKVSYSAEVAQLNIDIQTFNDKANNGGFDSVASFNAERNKLSKRINGVKTDEVNIQTEINNYNSKYDQYKAIALKIEALSKSIDSSVAPVPSL